MPQPPKNLRDFSALVQVMESLRGPDGCPWDKEQKHETLTQYAIEEAHELAEAIDHGSQQDLVEELGDLLLQVVLHAEIARQDKSFDIHDVIEGINQKMIRRHPHVFADLKVESTDEVMDNWQKIKAQEKSDKTENHLKDNQTSEEIGIGALDATSESSSTQKVFKGFNVPVTLPALLRSQKIGGKTTRNNFDWENVGQVIEKVDEEIGELKEAIASKDKDEQTHELGDVFFSVAQLARHLDIDAEQATRKANTRFETRFERMQDICAEDGTDFNSLNLEQLEALWQRAKKSLKT